MPRPFLYFAALALSGCEDATAFALRDTPTTVAEAFAGPAGDPGGPGNGGVPACTGALAATAQGLSCANSAPQVLQVESADAAGGAQANAPATVYVAGGAQPAVSLQGGDTALVAQSAGGIAADFANTGTTGNALRLQGGALTVNGLADFSAAKVALPVSANFNVCPAAAACTFHCTATQRLLGGWCSTTGVLTEACHVTAGSASCAASGATGLGDGFTCATAGVSSITVTVQCVDSF